MLETNLPDAGTPRLTALALEEQLAAGGGAETRRDQLLEPHAIGGDQAEPRLSARFGRRAQRGRGTIIRSAGSAGRP